MNNDLNGITITTAGGRSTCTNFPEILAYLYRFLSG